MNTNRIENTITNEIVLLNNQTYEFEKVIHISDVHLMNRKTKEEFEYVFSMFIQYIDGLPIYMPLDRDIIMDHMEAAISYYNNDSIDEACVFDTKRCCVISGDVIHKLSKLDALTIYLLKQFMKKLDQRLTVIICPGNHDLSVLYKEEFVENDTLHSIMFEQKLKHTFYLNQSGFYHVSKNLTIAFIHPSEDCRGKYVRFLKPDQCVEPRTYMCGLYHGAVIPHNKESFRFNKDRNYYTVHDFEPFHFTFLGDIHKAIDVDVHGYAAYASSMLQMTFGEHDVQHGFIEWDLATRTKKRFNLRNPYLFKNVYVVDKGIHLPVFLPYTKYIHLRIIYNTNATLNKRQYVQMKLREYISSMNIVILSETFIINYNVFKKCLMETPEIMPLEVTVDENKENLTELKIMEVKEDSPTTSESSEKNDHIIQKHQFEDDLRFYLEQKKLTASEEDIQEMVKIYKMESERLAKKVPEDDDEEESEDVMSMHSNHHDWTIEHFQFSNLLSYGSHNWIDFNKCQNIASISGPNTYGKSAIFDGIVFTLFGTSPRCTNINLLRSGQRRGYFEVIICVNRKDRYKFVRKPFYHNEKKENVEDHSLENELFLYEMKEGASEWTLIVKSKTDIKHMVTHLIGTYTSFIDQAVFLQNKMNSIMNQPKKEMYILFSNMFGLSHYNTMYKARSNSKFSSKVLQEKQADLEKRLAIKDKKKVTDQLELNGKRVEEIAVSISQLLDEIGRDEKMMEETQLRIDMNETYYADLLHEKENGSKNDDLLMYKRDLVSQAQHSQNTLQLLEEKIRNVQGEIRRLMDQQKKNRSNAVKNEENEHKMEELKYELCHSIKSVLESKINTDDMLKVHGFIDEFVKSVQDIYDSDASAEKNETMSILSRLNELREIEDELEEKKKECLSKCQEITKKVKEVEVQITSEISFFERQQEIENVKSMLQKDRIAFKQLTSALTDKRMKMKTYEMEVTVLETRNENILQTLKEIEQLEKELVQTIQYNAIVNLFYNSIHYQHGFPGMRLKTYLGVLERLMNENLQVFGTYHFKIKGGSDNISMYVSKDIDPTKTLSYYPIRNCSGWETLIMSLLLKVLIREMSPIPQFQCLFLDESLSNMDQENLVRFNEHIHQFNMFYEKIFIISHNSDILETIQDHIHIRRNREKISSVRYGDEPDLTGHRSYISGDDNSDDDETPATPTPPPPPVKVVKTLKTQKGNTKKTGKNSISLNLDAVETPKKETLAIFKTTEKEEDVPSPFTITMAEPIATPAVPSIPSITQEVVPKRGRPRKTPLNQSVEVQPVIPQPIPQPIPSTTEDIPKPSPKVRKTKTLPEEDTGQNGTSPDSENVKGQKETKKKTLKSLTSPKKK